MPMTISARTTLLFGLTLWLGLGFIKGPHHYCLTKAMTATIALLPLVTSMISVRLT